MSDSFVRCGDRAWRVSWLVIVLGSAAVVGSAGLVAWSRAKDDASRPLRPTGASAGWVAPAAEPHAPSAPVQAGTPAFATAKAARRGRRAQVSVPTHPMPAFCEGRWPTKATSLEPREPQWRFVAADALTTESWTTIPQSGWVDPSQPACVWREKTDTAQPFSICTFDRSHDRHVSASLQENGAWNADWKNLLEAALPLLGDDGRVVEGEALDPRLVGETEPAPAAARSAGVVRSVVLDVGANLGFFGLLAAARGYDVFAFDASVACMAHMTQSVVRNRFSLITSVGDAMTAARVRAAFRGQGGAARQPRRASVAVLHNAVGDAHTTVRLGTYGDNPGASYIHPAYDGDLGDATAEMVRLDDLVTQGWLDPRQVRAIKISAEMSDARVLHGARHLVEVGRPPLLLFIFNENHFADHGCQAHEFVQTMLQYGYRIYDTGVYRFEKADVQRYLERVRGRSSSMVFVEQSFRI